jgi:hypothetical protein
MGDIKRKQPRHPWKVSRPEGEYRVATVTDRVTGFYIGSVRPQTIEVGSWPHLRVWVAFVPRHSPPWSTRLGEFTSRERACRAMWEHYRANESLLYALGSLRLSA